jgi:hypothetical protein
MTRIQLKLFDKLTKMAFFAFNLRRAAMAKWPRKRAGLVNESDM